MNELDIGGAISRGFSTYMDNFVRFVTLAAIVIVPVYLASWILELALGAIAGGVVGFAFQMIGSLLLTGFLALAFSDSLLDKPERSAGELLSELSPQLPTLIVASLLAGLGIMIGIVLLVVPGIYLIVRWAFVTMRIVLEGDDRSEAFSKSAEIVSGNMWRMLGLILIGAIIAGVATGIIAGLVVAAIGTSLGALIGGVIAAILTTPITAGFTVDAYYQLAGVPDANDQVSQDPAQPTSQHMPPPNTPSSTDQSGPFT